MRGAKLAYVGLGANLGDRRQTLRAAVDQLRGIGAVEAVSSLYETAPVGYLDQPAFLNAVASISTDRTPVEIVGALLEIEAGLGRRRSFPNAPRTLDLDLLLLDAVISDNPAALVPHPRLHERGFVLAPLADLAPDLVHPVIGVTVAKLLAALGPLEGVNRVAGPEWVTPAADAAETAEGR
ncbi:MAG: 2-amino-4-hydroxy-6-hydroxymethyldihydropteridine diphosphokinase [Thermomicrobiales bacterium]